MARNKVVHRRSTSNGMPGTSRRPRHVAAKLRAKASGVTHGLRALGGIATQSAADRFGDLQDQASDYVAQGRDKLGEVQDSIVGFIREKPLTAILIAAGTGFVVSRLLLLRR